MTSPLKLVQILLSGLGNRSNSGPIAIRPRIFGSPTADRVLSDMRQAPIDSDTDYDQSVSPDMKQTQPTPWLDTRARQVTPPSELDKLDQESSWLRSRPDAGRGGAVIETPTRLKSGLLQALSGIGEAARRNMATGRTDWKDLAGVAGAGAGGAAVGAVDPGIIVRARHNKAVAENQAAINQELENENARSVIASRRANDEYKGSLQEKAIRDQQLRADETQRKRDYAQASLKIRQDALNGRISYQDYMKQDKELQRKFGQEKFEETKRHNQANEDIATSNAESNRIRALKPPAGTGDPGEAYDRANDLQKQIDELNAADQKEPAYKPVLDSKTKEVMTDAKGNVIYSNDFSDAYKQRQAQKKVLMAEKEKLFTEARKSKARASSNTTPAATPKGAFSMSKWKAANPSGDANAAAAKARRLGYTVTN